MMNLVELQDRLRNLSDDQLRRVATFPSQPIEATLAVGTLQEREKMRAEAAAGAQVPTQTVAERVVSGAPAQAAVPPPVGMNSGGRPEDAEDRWYRLASAVQGMRLPGMVEGADSLSSAMGLVGGLLPDRLSPLSEMRQNYEAGASERNNQLRDLALLQLGAGMLRSKDPTFLGALGEAGSGALSALGD